MSLKVWKAESKRNEKTKKKIFKTCETIIKCVHMCHETSKRGNKTTEENIWSNNVWELSKIHQGHQKPYIWKSSDLTKDKDQKI